MIKPNELLAAYVQDARNRYLKLLAERHQFCGGNEADLFYENIKQFDDLSEKEKESCRAEAVKIQKIFIGGDDDEGGAR